MADGREREGARDGGSVCATENWKRPTEHIMVMHIVAEKLGGAITAPPHTNQKIIQQYNRADLMYGCFTVSHFNGGEVGARRNPGDSI